MTEMVTSYGSCSLSSFKTFDGVFIVPAKHKVYVCVCSSVRQTKVTKSISQVLDSAISWQ